MEKKKAVFGPRDMALCALFAALSAAGAFIKIPLGPVPITMQFFFTNLAGLLLGKRRGLISVLLYIFIGLIGLPVFTGGGGPAYVLMPSFGYLAGMALGAWLSGLAVERGQGGFKSMIYGGLLGIFAMYGLGLLHFWLISAFYLDKPMGFWPMLVSYCLVFVPGDGLSLLLGAVLARRLRPLTKTMTGVS